MAGVSTQHVPYKGSGPALNDVISNLPSSSSHIKAGTPAAEVVAKLNEAANAHNRLRINLRVRARKFNGAACASVKTWDYRSVSFNSIRRLVARAASSSPSAIGWNSPKPAATRRFAGTPLDIRNFTTEVARAEESSQLS